MFTAINPAKTPKRQRNPNLSAPICDLSPWHLESHARSSVLYRSFEYRIRYFGESGSPAAPAPACQPQLQHVIQSWSAIMLPT